MFKLDTWHKLLLSHPVNIKCERYPYRIFFVKVCSKKFKTVEFPAKIT
jgi:hypothetical protein